MSTRRYYSVLTKESRLFLVFGLALVSSVRKYSPLMENDHQVEPPNINRLAPKSGLGARCREDEHGPLPDTQGGAIRFAGGYNNRVQQRGGLHSVRIPPGKEESAPCLSSLRARRNRQDFRNQRGADTAGKDSSKGANTEREFSSVRRLSTVGSYCKQERTVQCTGKSLLPIREDQPDSATGTPAVDKSSGHNLEVKHGLLHNVQAPDTKGQDVCLGKPAVRGEDEKGGICDNGKNEAVSGPRS